MKCATASARKLLRLKQADRDAAGLRVLSSAVNYLQRQYWRPVGWQTDADASAFDVLIAASFRIQADRMRRGVRPKEGGA